MIRKVLLVFAALLLTAADGAAHPMGNFSINHYSGLEIAPGEIRVRYILDLAEIPTFEEIEKIGLDQNGERTPGSEAAYLAERAAALAAGLELEVAGTRLPLVPISSEVTFPPGAGGLPTTRLSILYRAPMPIRPVASGPAD